MVFQLASRAIEMEESRPRPVSQRFLRNLRFWEVVLEVGDKHLKRL